MVLQELMLQLLLTQSCCVQFCGAAVAFPVLHHGLLAALVCCPALGITQPVLFVHGHAVEVLD